MADQNLMDSETVESQISRFTYTFTDTHDGNTARFGAANHDYRELERERFGFMKLPFNDNPAMGGGNKLGNPFTFFDTKA